MLPSGIVKLSKFPDLITNTQDLTPLKAKEKTISADMKNIICTINLKI